MGKLVILSSAPNEVIILNVSKKQERKLEKKYGGDTYTWLTNEGAEDKIGFNLDCATFMWMDEGVDIRNVNF